MGAPQALLDRMFASSSEQIELIPAEEFRAFYKDKESYFEEWLIAKCGTDDYRGVLNDKEFDDFRKMEMWQIGARAKGNLPIRSLYPDPNYPDDYVNAVYKKIRDHNRLLANCREGAVTSHQREWARRFKQPA